MKQLFKSEVKLRNEIFDRTPIAVIEKEFIISFFKELPIEDLKRLVNYEILNPTQENIRTEPRVKEKFRQLAYENCIELRCELWLDNSINDLSLGQIS
ncbi:hypothetical protein [Flavobacterium sp. TAB 87]|uniref:hypothetical protein n=1 Tax=Flavobacterium sp. TAB 87 TaxID=1729581 RepID=UPI00076BEC5D|nr:hypothetical protein [Flavobacterium sp. TAB 87]KVV16116.1 hypothetical protein AP058_00281 [Flavobacterium sp. TAB 87]